MGKRQIGEMQPFEFIVTLIIADIACIPMADVSIPLWYGIVGVLSLFLLHQTISIIEHFGNGAKKIISGKPSIVINKDGIDIKELKKNNIDVEDLFESLRTSGYFSFDDVDYAIYEASGKFSALNGQNKSPSLSILIVNEGKINKNNINVLGVKESEIISFLNTNNATLKQTEVLTIDGSGRTYIKIKNQKYKIANFTLPEGKSW